MNFHPFVEALVHQLKDSIFAPKDQFERAKRSVTRSLILPLIGVLGAESALVGILSSIGFLQFRSGENVFTLAGSASDSFLTLSVVVLLAFSSVIGSNLYYARHLKRSEREIEELAEKARLTASYDVLKSKFTELSNAKALEEAYSISVLIFKLYPDHARKDPDFFQRLLSDSNLAAIKQLQAIVPERVALPIETGQMGAPNQSGADGSRRR